MDILSLAPAVVPRSSYGSGWHGSHRCSDISRSTERSPRQLFSRGLGCVRCARNTSNRAKPISAKEGASRSRHWPQCLKPTVSRGPAFKRTIPARSRWTPAHACGCSACGLRVEADRSGAGNDSCLYLGASRSIRGSTTPSAVTVDLGCAYTLQVDDSGAGMVRTSLGWVGFKLNWPRSPLFRRALLKATRPKVGPGTPYFEDAPEEFRSALARFDFDDATSQQRAHDVAICIAREAS